MIPKYSPALRNAVCAVSGRILCSKVSIEIWSSKRGEECIHLRFSDPSFSITPLSRTQASHQDTLRSTTRSNTRSSDGRVEHSQNHRNDLRLHLPHPGKHVRMNWISNSEQSKRLGLQFDQLISPMIHSSRHESIFPARVVHIRERLKLFAHCIFTQTFFGKC